jgi:MFS family permease
MLRRFSGLWRHPDFMKLWIGQTISSFGTHITRDGLPILAVTLLAATPAQMGFLAAVGSVPGLLLSLLAGVWVDRLPRRPILISADLGRMALLLLIPAAALTGHLSFGLLCVVLLLTGTLSIFFEVAYRSILPSLVTRESVVEGNSKLATTEALAEVGGPPLTGVLIQVITAPLAICFDALSFLISAISLLLIKAPDSTPAPRQEGQTVWREMGEGLRLVRNYPLLRSFAIQTGIRSFFGNFYAALYMIYVIQDLGMSPTTLGLLIAGGGLGVLIAAPLASWLPRRFGMGPTLTTTLLIASFIGLLTPLAGGPTLLAAAMLFAAQVIGDGLMTIYAINELSLRQMVVPDHLLGRSNASIGFLAQGIAPLGAVVGGLLAGIIGTRATLLIAVLGGIAAALWLLGSPVRSYDY